jgi:hypothetical protein
MRRVDVEIRLLTTRGGKYINLASNAVIVFGLATEPGKWAVDAIPFREFHVFYIK